MNLFLPIIAAAIAASTVAVQYKPLSPVNLHLMWDSSPDDRTNASLPATVHTYIVYNGNEVAAKIPANGNPTGEAIVPANPGDTFKVTAMNPCCESEPSNELTYEPTPTPTP